MKKALAAIAFSAALLLTGCAGSQTAQSSQAPSAAPQTTSASPVSATTQAASTASPSASADSFSSAVAQGIEAQVKAAAGDTSKYLPAVRATVKTGTDDELVNYGAQVCAAGTTDGVNAITNEMTSKGYSKDDAMTVAVSAGFFLCPKK